LRLRAPAHEGLLRKLLEEIRVGRNRRDRPAPALSAGAEEMLRADGLLVLQASNCNDQIPAKAYEYLRSGGRSSH